MNDPIQQTVKLLREHRAKIDAALEALESANGFSAPEAEPTPKKRTMSAEARKRIGDATRKRWKERRAAMLRNR